MFSKTKEDTNQFCDKFKEKEQMNEIREAMENKNSIEIETMKTQIAMLKIKKY